MLLTILPASPSCSVGQLASFLKLDAVSPLSCCNLFKCCSWHSSLSCSCVVIIWDLSVNFKVEVLNFYRHAQNSWFQKLSCIFSKLECDFKVFKFRIRFRFLNKSLRKKFFFFLSVRFKLFFKKKDWLWRFILGCWDVDTQGNAFMSSLTFTLRSCAAILNFKEFLFGCTFFQCCTSWLSRHMDAAGICKCRRQD